MLVRWDRCGVMMLGTVDRQGSLLGVDSLLARLFEGDDDSFYARMAAHGGEIIRDEDFAECYSAGRGRPSIPPSLLMRAVLCQSAMTCRTGRRLGGRRRIWIGSGRWASKPTRSRFITRRCRCSAPGCWSTTPTVSCCPHDRAGGQGGLFPKRVLGIVDSTGVMGAAAVADTYELLRQAIAKVIGAAGGPKALPARLRKRARAYVRGKADIDWADRLARRDGAGPLVDTARELLAATADNDELAEARKLLERIIDQDIEQEPDDGGGPGIRHGVATDRVVSVVDPEMRHGRKSPSSRVDGYKAHVLTDHDNEFILGVATTPANVPDGPEAAGLVAAARDAGVPVAEVLGDTAYGDGDTRIAVEAAGAKITAKTQPPATTGKFLKTDFVDRSGHALPRPARPDTPPRTTGWHATARAAVSGLRSQRALRRLLARALVAPPSRRSDRDAQLPRSPTPGRPRRASSTIDERKLRRRSLVERKLAELKMHGLGKARYRGQRKILLQLRLTAGMVNLKKLFTLESRPDSRRCLIAPARPRLNRARRPQPPPSPLAEHHFFGSHLDLPACGLPSSGRGWRAWGACRWGRVRVTPRSRSRAGTCSARARARQNSMSLASSSDPATMSASGCTTARTSSPHSSLGAPTTVTSATAGCSSSAASISAG